MYDCLQRREGHVRLFAEEIVIVKGLGWPSCIVTVTSEVVTVKGLGWPSCTR